MRRHAWPARAGEPQPRLQGPERRSRQQKDFSVVEHSRSSVHLCYNDDCVYNDIIVIFASRPAWIARGPHKLARKSVVSGKRVSVRLDFGGRRNLKKKKR